MNSLRINVISRVELVSLPFPKSEQIMANVQQKEAIQLAKKTIGAIW